MAETALKPSLAELMSNTERNIFGDIIEVDENIHQFFWEFDLSQTKNNAFLKRAEECIQLAEQKMK